jgi:hypothetical protein
MVDVPHTLLHHFDYLIPAGEKMRQLSAEDLCRRAARKGVSRFNAARTVCGKQLICICKNIIGLAWKRLQSELLEVISYGRNSGTFDV